MVNSSLVSYTKISPNKTVNRNHKIDTLTIHMVVGQLTVESIGNIFQPGGRQASSNYGIGRDGRIGMYVEEKDRSWCSSNAANDHRAVTIEVASDVKSPYAVTEIVMESLINLCADVCYRNGIAQLLWKDNKAFIGRTDLQNMTLHKWFANTSCPGEYLHSKMGEIASKTNAKLAQIRKIIKLPALTLPEKDDILVIAQEVLNGKWGNGQERKDRLTVAGYNYNEVQNAVNQILYGAVHEPQKPKLKPLDDISKEVINGKWGNGQERKDRLIAAGYDYSKVQKRVNELLR